METECNIILLYRLCKNHKREVDIKFEYQSLCDNIDVITLSYFPVQSFLHLHPLQLCIFQFKVIEKYIPLAHLYHFNSNFNIAM
jgi:hypothetical protein